MEYLLNWKSLLSAKRLGSASHVPKSMARSQFQRDYDRIIFSSPFRRLQNKTQVFPLPGSIFVHNRLTHSLEVASVGRSLGNLLAVELEKRPEGERHDFFPEFGSIVSAACLAHDMGNPPFGHSGEKAISRYFSDGEGQSVRGMVNDHEWRDLTHFEGNANAFRVLTHRFNGRREGGFALTYATLASLVKYPYGSDAADEKKYKYGYFASERETFEELAREQELLRLAVAPERYCRHPLVYLVEAADDITYQIMDVEDAHKLKILSGTETQELLTAFWDSGSESDRSFFSMTREIFDTVIDANERVSYLRAMLINKLVNECVAAFLRHYAEIMNGQFHRSLVDSLEGASAAGMKRCRALSVERIYNHPSVIEVELAGYRILGALLNEFVGAALHPQSHYAQKLLALLPEQFRSNTGDQPYTRIQSVLDFVSGMTDLYALELYRNIHGMQISYQ
ncbi:MAG: deoxyguanosinetriphosphate triphosphohydrolase [Bacteroidales bacterium]|jgi:dGTPase|nr:deoxyguanosinetriphosphate triphosphohydrolase [Bacteroidales bacterium]